jgi:cytochrome c biogenesis protein CcmG/thiol:disulfide interchange protein DsbE
MNIKSLIPLGIFLVLAVFLYIGLGLNPRTVPSPLIGKPAPAFTLPALDNLERMVSPEDFKGQPWLFNVWATWCVSCRAEHQLLVALSQQIDVPIVGLNYKDEIPAAQEWIQQLGNPYVVTAVDADGRIGIDWGVYGTPETYVIDKDGIIRYKQIGPVDPQSLQTKILPLLKELQG